jgi:RNA polymerase sigma-70 factor (ECF subfamily)
VSPSGETERLYERYGKELYRYCLVRLKSPQEAEDAVQNTFIRVFRALEKDVEPEFELAWLYRIATNVCLSRQGLTSRRAQWQSPRAVDDLEVPARESEPETARELVAAVTDLPKNLRDAFLLREWRGLSYVEIAESLGTSVAAVETLLVRARRNLAATLRRGAALVNPALLLRLRPSGAGPAPIAAGAAALALGGAVVGTQVGQADTHAPRPHVAPAPELRADLPLLRATTAGAHARARVPAPRSPAGAKSTRLTAPPPASSGLRTVAPVLRPPEPADAAQPAARDPAPAPASAARPAAQSPVNTTTTAVLALLPPAPALPEPGLPADPLPTVSIPTVSIPTVTVPAVGTVPSVHVP